MVRQLPAEDARAELARAAGDGGGGDAGALGVELVALAEPGEHVAAPVGVGDRELAQARLGLAGVDQRLQRPPSTSWAIASPSKTPDSDRVGTGVGGRRWWRRRRIERNVGAGLIRLDTHASNRDPGQRPNACRQARRRPFVAPSHRPRRHRHQGRAGARRRGARAGRARRDGPGAAGRRGPDPLAPGADQGGHPEGGLVGDDQQGLRLGHPRGRDDRRGDPRRRPRGGGRRRHGVDVAGAVPAAEGALRLPHGRRARRSTRWSRTACATRSRASRCSRRRPRSASSSR